MYVLVFYDVVKIGARAETQFRKYALSYISKLDEVINSCKNSFVFKTKILNLIVGYNVTNDRMTYYKG